MKVNSTAIKRPKDRDGKNVRRDSLIPLFVKEKNGKFFEVSQRPKTKPFWTLYSKAQLDDFIELNNGKKFKDKANKTRTERKRNIGRR